MLMAINDKTELDSLLRELKPGLMQLKDNCLNGEALISALGAKITPFDAFFVRCNGDVPVWLGASANDWPIVLDGLVGHPTRLTLGDLKVRFPICHVTAVIECAGNGRALFDTPADGLQWRHGAVGCALWTGVRLRDVLLAAGLGPQATHLGFESADSQLGQPGKLAFSRGLPLSKALADETILAFEMNGAPLHALHGGPLRVVAPGFPGAAWQKWVNRIIVRADEHDGPKMTGLDYRIDGQVIEDMPVKSLITEPLEGFVRPADGTINVVGFAWSGHVAVASVELSGDGGQTWLPATLATADGRFAWRPFRGAVSLKAGEGASVMARAIDAAGRSQPIGDVAWNPKGYCNNAIHVVAALS